jgi:trehalose-phosphatase
MREIEDLTRRVRSHLNQGHPMWLFLDYDGTLADFAPTPEVVEPDPHLIHILHQLSHHPMVRLALISGRMLSQIRALVPLDRVFLAGTYGVEIQLPGGEVVQRFDSDTLRPVIERVKAEWTGLVQGLKGFFVEDKHWAVALHARYAGKKTSDRVLHLAREVALDEIEGDDLQLLGGQRFLEVGPRLAHKGMTVAWLLDNFPLPEALLVYLGDDDKDEQAYTVIHARGGVSVLVGGRMEASWADYHLEGPAQARNWLNNWADCGGG